jgi:hypothetical protein
MRRFIRARLPSSESIETCDCGLPFLQHSSVLFTSSEISTLALSSERHPLSSLTRLQRAKSHNNQSFHNIPEESSSTSSSSLIPGTDQPSYEDDLISARVETSDDYGPKLIVPMVTASPTSNKCESDDDAEMVDALPDKVWRYLHRRRAYVSAGHVTEYTAAFENGMAVPAESKGRKHLLSVIRRVPHSPSIKVWPSANHIEVLTDTSHCARELRDFITKRGERRYPST